MMLLPRRLAFKVRPPWKKMNFVFVKEKEILYSIITTPCICARFDAPAIERNTTMGGLDIHERRERLLMFRDGAFGSAIGSYVDDGLIGVQPRDLARSDENRKYDCDENGQSCASRVANTSVYGECCRADPSMVLPMNEFLAKKPWLSQNLKTMHNKCIV